MDKLYVHGRVWADRAHRVTALGLIGATVLCGAVTLFTFGEMVVHNRRLKKEYVCPIPFFPRNTPFGWLADQPRSNTPQSQSTASQTLPTLPPADRASLEKTPLVAAAAAGPSAASEDSQPGKGLIATIKTWSMKGLTPVDDEYRDSYSKGGRE